MTRKASVLIEEDEHGFYNLVSRTETLSNSRCEKGSSSSVHGTDKNAAAPSYIKVATRSGANWPVKCFASGIIGQRLPEC